MAASRFLPFSGLLLLFSVLLPRAAGATPLVLDNSWRVLNDFSPLNDSSPGWFTGTGTLSLTESGATSYTWNSPASVKFDITDVLVVGDAFRVFDNGVFVATFSSRADLLSIPACKNPFSGACHWAGNPDLAWLDPLFNQGSLIFAPGAHGITIEAMAFPDGFTDGTVAFRAALVPELAGTPVPEPTSLVLLGSGLLAAARWGSRRRAAR
jgi:hypothetical protein